MEITTPIKSLHGHISSLAKNNPKKTALLACDEGGAMVQEISYLELLQKIEDAAAYLHNAGLERGDRVALAFRNSVELLILSWAAWGAGIVTVPLDIKRDTVELYQYKIKLTNAKLLIVQEWFDATHHRGIPKTVDVAHIPEVAVREFSGFGSESGATIDWEPGLSYTALILFTSGTTAYPKGAKLTLENLIVNAEGIREWLHITGEDRFLVNLPLHHINSTTFCLSTLLSGGSIAIPPGYSNSRFWRQAAKTQATYTSIVQSILFDQLSREHEFAAVKPGLKLNRIQIGSAPVVAQTVQEFMKKFQIPLYQGYGQTETALRVTGVPMDLPPRLYEQLVEENSIGAPMPWADLQIADENGNILGENQEGELVVSGPAIMEGYIGKEPAFRSGYFLTGDIGFYRLIEGKRYFFLKGRKKEMIIKGGINISPVAIENQLKRISVDIDQVYVIGIPDKRYGEEVAAVICWKKDANEESAKRRLKYALVSGTPLLSLYETPACIASLTAEDLPVTSTGKVQRTVLKDKVPFDQFESIYLLFETSLPVVSSVEPSMVSSVEPYRFLILGPQSPYIAESLALYNHCWQPLVIDSTQYKENIRKQCILLAVDTENKIAGQIAFIRTDLGSRDLLHTSYRALVSAEANPNGPAFVCVSICSSGFEPKTVPSMVSGAEPPMVSKVEPPVVSKVEPPVVSKVEPSAIRIPDAEAVRAYLRDGNDPVLRFHQKPKAGLPLGAELVDVIAAGRPEDASSLGYTMLLKYPSVAAAVGITNEAPVANQLIEAVLLIAKDNGIEDVYAYSRPGGLAAYMAKQS